MNAWNNRFSGLVVVLSGLLGMALVVGVEASERRPNVLILLADDLGYGDVGCYGAELIETPRIDQLADEGALFTQAHAPAAVCQPTRYGLMAGRYNWRRGKPWDGSYMFGDDEPTLQRELGRAGYATAAFGKWHNGWGHGAVDYNEELKPGPLESGFDYFFGTPRSHNEPPQVFVENRRVYKHDPDDPLRIISHEEVVDRGLKDWGWGLSEGAEAAHAARPEERIDLIVAERAAEFLRRQSSADPFLLYVAFVAPHVPISPAEEFQGTSRAGRYGDYVQQLDAAVGIVLDALAGQGFAEDTLVIFTSDNGAVYMRSAVDAGHRQNADLLGQKTDAWCGGNQVPFIVRWPGRVPAGVASDTFISLTDIMATVAAASGLELPDGAAPDSLNQLPVLLDPVDAGPVREQMVFTGIFGQGLYADGWVYYPFQGSGGMSAHPTQRWGQPYERVGMENSDHHPDGTLKDDAPPAQLYDIDADPGQTTNLHKEHPQRVEKMQLRLEKALAPPLAPEGDGSTLETGGDAPRKSPLSWNSDVWGEPPAPPARRNHYIHNERAVWLLALGRHGSFPGESLTLRDNASIWLTGGGTLGAGELILDGGQIQHRAAGTSDVEGAIRVASDSKILVVDGALNLQSRLTGGGELRLGAFKRSTGITIGGDGRDFEGAFHVADSAEDGARLEVEFATPFPEAKLVVPGMSDARMPVLVLRDGESQLAAVSLPAQAGGLVDLAPGVYDAAALDATGVAPGANRDAGGTLRVGSRE